MSWAPGHAQGQWPLCRCWSLGLSIRDVRMIVGTGSLGMLDEYKNRKSGDIRMNTRIGSLGC